MSPDDFQKAWKAESAQTRVTVDIDQFLPKLKRSQRDFRFMIQLRDYREAFVALVMLPVWLYLGITTYQPWSWYLTVPALCWVIGFIVVDRIRQNKKGKAHDGALSDNVRVSLAEVEHQIWLLRNVAWWYLLPFFVGISVYFTDVSWSRSSNWQEALGTATVANGLVLVMYYFIYYLNQRAVRTQLVPQRDELLTLYEGLHDEPTGEAIGEYPILMGTSRLVCSRRRVVLANVCMVTIVLIVIPAILFFSYTVDQYLDPGFPKLAPYTDVRWEDDSPVVEVDGQWCVLYSLDGIGIDEIVDYCKETYPTKWQKRFAEDLVEVLSGMGHVPGDTVELVVSPVDPPAERAIREVPMTAGNRRAVRNAAQKRASAREQSQALESEEPNLSKHATPSDSIAPFETELETIRASYKLPAMAAFALRGNEVVERATVGTRSTSDDTPVGRDAQWHVGSNTKAMTATVGGMLVEEGLLSWESTIGEVLGEAAPNMNEAHRDTTLTQLLHHISGITPNISWYTAPEDRLDCAAEILKSAPEGKRGEYLYSNAGYVVAGAMMEAVTGKRWEVLMQERLFKPLGMNDTGFGAPAGDGAPWGHRSGLLSWTPMSPSKRGADNAPVLGPAGTVHTTLDDYAKFIGAHLTGARGEGGLVSADTFSKLHTPYAGGEYALGWIVTERGWAGGTALTHGGSNTMWFATVWLAPETNMAYFAVTNAGGNTAFKAVDEAVTVLIGRHGG